MNQPGVFASAENNVSVAHHQHWQMRIPQHALRHAAQHQFLDPAAAVGAHHDQVGARGVGSFQHAAPHGVRFDYLGLGIDARLLQARGSILDGGTGLGLAIVDRIARQHGGELQLLPNTPRGLRAVLLLRDA